MPRLFLMGGKTDRRGSGRVDRIWRVLDKSADVAAEMLLPDLANWKAIRCLQA